MRRLVIALLAALFLLFCSCSPNIWQDLAPTTAQPTTTPPDDAPQPAAIPDGAQLQVIFFDVGQGDCILVTTEDRAMLIDAGNIGQDELVTGYLAEYGVTSLDYLVATHPHADHIGAMPAVINTMERVGLILMPDVIHTTQIFERLLDTIMQRDVAAEIPVPGGIYELGAARIQILAPNGDSYSDLNNYSIVLRIDFGETSFLLTGDAEAISESEQLESGFSLSADVLKAAHHGSRTSSTRRYLSTVSPTYVVISCGKDNSYGHPHDETLESFAEIGVKIYRTDENGTIIFTSDGSNLTVNEAG